MKREPRWMTPGGEAVSCIEKIRVLNENLGELREMAQEALDSTAATWEEITDRLGRDEQMRLYHDAIGYEG